MSVTDINIYCVANQQTTVDRVDSGLDSVDSIEGAVPVIGRGLVDDPEYWSDEQGHDTQEAPDHGGECWGLAEAGTTLMSYQQRRVRPWRSGSGVCT